MKGGETGCGCVWTRVFGWKTEGSETGVDGCGRGVWMEDGGWVWTRVDGGWRGARLGEDWAWMKGSKTGCGRDGRWRGARQGVHRCGRGFGWKMEGTG